MELDLGDKIVLISGATGGIGTAICEAFLKEGAVIVPLYRNVDKYNLLYEYLKSRELNVHKIYPQKIDLGNSDSVNNVVRNVKKKFGRLDILVNNAGSSTERLFLLLEEEDWEKQINVNLNSTARILRAVLKHMFIEKKGAVVNISSLLSRRHGRGVSAYASAKAGIDRLTQTLAQEVGAKGVRINSICPGLIKTKMSMPLISRMGDNIMEQTALKRFGQPSEVAKAVLFLSSEKTASFITGHLLHVDGGYLL